MTAFGMPCLDGASESASVAGGGASESASVAGGDTDGFGWYGIERRVSFVAQSVLDPLGMHPADNQKRFLIKAPYEEQSAINQTHSMCAGYV